MDRLIASLSAAAALFFLCTIPSDAGTLTLDPGQPSFNPAAVFSNNTITAQVVGGNLVQIFGNTDIVTGEGSSATIGVTGSFSGSTGDIFSFFYNFSVNLNSSVPVQVTLQGTANTQFGPLSVNDTFTLMQGMHDYTGMKETSPAPVGLSGTYSGTITFDFLSPTSQKFAQSKPRGLANFLTLSIPQNGLDFQVAPTAIPEPSTFALAAFGFSGLLLALKRRRLA